MYCIIDAYGLEFQKEKNMDGPVRCKEGKPKHKMGIPAHNIMILQIAECLHPAAIN